MRLSWLQGIEQVLLGLIAALKSLAKLQVGIDWEAEINLLKDCDSHSYESA
jgi:hypothetical protein